MVYHIVKIAQFLIYKLITPSNIIYNSIIFNILHFLDSGFTHLYLLHLFQGLKCLTLACHIFKISQFNIYKQSNITYFSIIFNILHSYNYQGERTQGEQVIGRTDPEPSSLDPPPFSIDNECHSQISFDVGEIHMYTLSLL